VGAAAKRAAGAAAKAAVGAEAKNAAGPATGAAPEAVAKAAAVKAPGVGGRVVQALTLVAATVVQAGVAAHVREVARCSESPQFGAVTNQLLRLLSQSGAKKQSAVPTRSSMKATVKGGGQPRTP